MGKKKFEATDLDRARDELFSHIQRCGVLEAEVEQREEWLSDTIDYLAERYPDLSASDLDELKNIGRRYCSPAIPHGDSTAEDVHGRLANGELAEGGPSETAQPAPARGEPLQANDEERSEVGAA